MQLSERSLLIQSEDVKFKIARNEGLSLFFAIICIIDVFGVFPIVALPKAIIDCGIYGIILIVVVCSLQIYTSILLGRCWIIAEKIEPAMNSKSRYPYTALTEFTFGKYLANIVTVLVDITVFAGGIPNLIVASQNLQLLGLRLTNEDLNISFCFWILILGTVLCPILWLGSPKDMKCLCTLSACIVLSVFFLINGSILYKSEEEEEPSPELISRKSTWEYLLIAYGTVTFQFDIHPTILTIHVDMKDKKKISNAVIGSFLFSLSMFAVTCTNAYLRYGNSLKPSILETLSSTVWLHAASVLVSIQLCLTSAISNSALYQHMEESLHISREFNQKRCILRTILIILAIIIAESVPRFDIVMSLIGATLTSPLVFILPPLIYLKILKLRDEHEEQLAMESFTTSAYTAGETSKNTSESEISGQTEFISFLKGRNESFCSKRSWQFILCFSIALVSVFCTVTATYLNMMDAVNFNNFSYPCIYNISFNY